MECAIDMLQIEVANEQTLLDIDKSLLKKVARRVLTDHGVNLCEVSIAVVNNETIHALNRQYLQHDYATDALSFVFEKDENSLTGEVIVSAEMAIDRCQEFRWQAENELLLYVVHALLHLVGYDDQDAKNRVEMKRAEQLYLNKFNIEPPNSD